MTAKKLAEQLELEPLTSAAGDGVVQGCYVCDLLSLCMSKVQEGDVWITVQANINIVAIAVLTELACIVIAEGMQVADDVLAKANDEGVAIYRSGKSAYALATAVSQLL